MKLKKKHKLTKLMLNNLKMLLPQNRKLRNYLSLSQNSVKEQLLSYDIITFDIFDTLITRKIYKPDDLFKIIDYKLKNETALNLDFFNLRKQAEKQAVSQKGNLVNIHDIYEALAKISNLSLVQVEKIKNLEVETEYKICIPREDVLTIFNELVLAGKKIILLSDMYLPKDIIKNILNKCGYHGYYDIWVSCEIGCRKDNSSMWKKFFAEYGSYLTIHIGDNEHSDIKNVAKESKQSLYFMDSKKMFGLTDFFKYLNLQDLKIGDSCILGLLVNKSFCNSPFIFNSNGPEISMSTLRDFGYTIYGPAFLYFFIWLNEQLKNNNIDILLFSSREGYFLKKMYEQFNELTDNSSFKRMDTHYFYISRRATSVANIQNLRDIKEILEANFKGQFSLLLESRFGIKISSNSNDPHIKLPKDIDFVNSLLEPYIETILTKAKQEKVSYLKYIESIDEKYQQKNIAVIDLGYSGTAQYYLSKLINKKVDGYYFILSNNIKPKKIGCNASSSFGQQTSNGHWLLFEAFLVAPHGQLSHFEEIDNKVKPIFINQTIEQSKIEQLQEIFNGVNDFFKDSIELLGNNLSTELYSTDLIKNIFYNVFLVENMVSANITDFFTVEARYTGNVKERKVLK